MNISNIVVLYQTGIKLKVNELGSDFKCDCLTLNGAVYRSLCPKATLRIYDNGKILVTGVKSLTTGEEVVARFLSRFPNARVKSRSIVNIVATIKFLGTIDLSHFSDSLKDRVNHEPELFPAAVYKFLKGNAKAIVFQSGKVNLVGAKSIKQLNDMHKEIRSALEWKFIDNIINPK